MNLDIPKWLIKGLAASLLCAIVLALVSHGRWFGFYGLIIALVVAVSIQNGRGEAYGHWPARASLVLTLVAYFLAKGGGAYLVADDLRTKMLISDFTSQDAILWKAELIAAERQAAGKTIAWPRRRSDDRIRRSENFPQDILAEAALWWDRLTAGARSQLLSDFQQAHRQKLDDVAPNVILRYMFEPNNPTEFYFLGVSLLIAFRVAFRSNPDEPAAEVASAGETSQE